ncbi:MAG: HNH endonuclease signature motif containing protein, partial [Burkholderiaceae bacterium]
IYQRARVLGLGKSVEYFQREAAGRFPKGKTNGRRFAAGMVPWNKGLKGWVAKGTEATQFKPGNKPLQTMPVGSYRINYGVLQQKISEEPGSPSKRWRAVHELVWIAANGPLPRGHIVIFKPGMKTFNPEEITPDKLLCLSRAEHGKKIMDRTAPEMRQLYQLKGAIARQVNRIAKEAEEQE